MSRTKNTLLNFSGNLINIFATRILGFVSRTIFIYYLDKSYLGINGLYSNLLSMLSLAELGVGTAIVYCLYKPLAEKDNEKIDVLMSFYRKAYTMIGIAISVIGTILGLFLDVLIEDITNLPNYQLYYYLFLFNTVSTYLITYKTALLSADQKAYKLTKYNVFFQSLAQVFQILVLVLTRNYTFYLLVQIFVVTVQKIFTNRFISKEYPKISFKSKEKLGKTEAESIKKNVIAMCMQKVGGYIVFGTDNLLIARFVNLATVGVYANYTMIIDIISSLISTLFSSVAASVGNLTATDKRKEFDIYKTCYMINYLLASTAVVCLYVLFNPFISIWIGDEFVFERRVVIVIILNFYMTSMRKSIEIFYNSNGLFWYSRYKSLIEALINLCISIILARKIGILGILIGTSVSSILTSVVYDSYVLFKYGFKQNLQCFRNEFILKYIVYMGMTISISLFCEKLAGTIGYQNIFLLIVDGILCVVVTLFINFLCWGKSDEFQIIRTKVIGILRLVFNR